MASGLAIAILFERIGVRFLVTGAADFIDSEVGRLLVLQEGAEVLNLDNPACAARLTALADIDHSPFTSSSRPILPTPMQCAGPLAGLEDEAKGSCPNAWCN
jgi:hypothetical protein